MTDHPALVAIGIFVAYTVLVAVLWKVNGVRYDAIAEWGGRDAGWSELVVVLVSCALFGLLHGINAFFGQSLQTTVQQIVFATVMGASFYAIRMSTGTLVVCMLTHALWDVATLGQTTTGREQKPAVGFLALGTFAVGLVAAGVIVATS